ncbi:hypothetical protein [Bowmanella dokdonensis]|uniref:Uncharacterized protein n=1 Tax=Bowmanella dokdonensis TaxID=751969 RepID=A0A939DMT9_9ALTE|nr:hypothetical protein [Bowmanella dokdonensis]MBN7825132.1 hypothetical protein [Bowmanella dokdonensis]
MSDFNYLYVIDLAKLQFSIHGEDRYGIPLIHKSVIRTSLLKEMANLSEDLIRLKTYWFKVDAILFI